MASMADRHWQDCTGKPREKTPPGAKIGRPFPKGVAEINSAAARQRFQTWRRELPEAVRKVACLPGLDAPSFGGTRGFVFHCIWCQRSQVLAGFKKLPCRARPKGTMTCNQWLQATRGKEVARRQKVAIAIAGAAWRKRPAGRDFMRNYNKSFYHRVTKHKKISKERYAELAKRKKELRASRAKVRS